MIPLGKSNFFQLTPLDFLHQDEVWQARQDGSLVILRLDDMEGRHLANLRAWLLDNAGRLQSMTVSALYGMASHVGGEQASLDLDQAIGQAEDESPEAWITRQPLFRGISRRLGLPVDDDEDDPNDVTSDEYSWGPSDGDGEIPATQDDIHWLRREVESLRDSVRALQAEVRRLQGRPETGE
jgi:hypothetical protein